MVTNGHLSVLLVVIFTIAVVLRFVNVVQLGYFMMDEERDAFLVRRMLVDHRPLLIGGAIPGGINVGPLFFYLSAIPYALSNLNPIGPAYTAALVGVLSVAAVYFVGRKLFGEKTAILATIFSGFSLLNIIYHRPWWPLTLSQLVTLTTYLSLFQLTKLRRNFNHLNDWNSWKWTLILVLALIVGSQSDPSTLSLIPLSIIWLWWWRKKLSISRKLVFTAIGLFLLAHVSWFIFELRHDFLNTRAAFNLIKKGVSLNYVKETPYQTTAGPASVFKMTAGVLYRLFIPTGYLDVTKQISPAEEFLRPRLKGIWRPGGWGLLALFGVYVMRVLKGPALQNQGRALISLHFVISLTGILFYTSVFPGYVHEWMWAFMFPGFFLMTADILISLSNKVRPWAPKVGPLLIGVWTVWELTLFSKLTNVAGLGKKLRVVQTVQGEIAGRPYELRSEGEVALRYGGWRYLFTLYGNPPVKSYMDYVYQDWLYPKSDVKPEVVIKVSSVGDRMRYEIEN